MAQLKIAILGASGIGRFHFREFARAGVKVTAILGSSYETAERTAVMLSSEFGLRPKAYSELGVLIEAERPDAASVCTPPELHYDQVKMCLAAGLHVLCEKPFVLNSDGDASGLATELVRLAKKRGRVITVNTQWPSVLRYVQPFVDVSKIRDFFMYTQPGVRGAGILRDHPPHANSMLVKLVPDGRAEDIEFLVSSPEEMDVNFEYRARGSRCAVRYKFKFKAARPRDLEFSINGVAFKRHIGEGYSQKLVTGKTEIDIEDPFKTSIGMFVGAIEGRSSPLISTQEIIENVRLQDRIIKAYVAEKGKQ